MRRSLGFSALALLFVFPLMTTFSLHAQEMSAQDQGVWHMEEMYWKYVQTGDADDYMKLWHQNVLGWPRDWDSPGGRDRLEKVARAKMAESRVAKSEFLSKVVRVTGNIGITQYAVKAERVGKGGKMEIFTSRITHTWLKTGDTWQIIGGMSAPLEPSGHTW
jgi:ketosteroid isomerase-like protein